MQESILCTFVKIWSFYPKYRNFSCFVILEMVILVRAINKYFQKIHLKCKNILQRGKETFTKTTLKDIEGV